MIIQEENSADWENPLFPSRSRMTFISGSGISGEMFCGSIQGRRHKGFWSRRQKKLRAGSGHSNCRPRRRSWLAVLPDTGFREPIICIFGLRIEPQISTTMTGNLRLIFLNISKTKED